MKLKISIAVLTLCVVALSGAVAMAADEGTTPDGPESSIFLKTTLEDGKISGSIDGVLISVEADSRIETSPRGTIVSLTSDDGATRSVIFRGNGWSQVSTSIDNRMVMLTPSGSQSYSEGVPNNDCCVCYPDHEASFQSWLCVAGCIDCWCVECACLAGGGGGGGNDWTSFRPYHFQTIPNREIR